MFSVRILHISDVHLRSISDSTPATRVAQVNREAFRRNRVLQSFRKDLRKIAASGQVDLVCFTGDAADWGRDEEFAAARAMLIGVLDDAGVNASRLFVVPGNHDIDRSTGSTSWATLRSYVGSLGESGLSDWVAGGRTPLGVAPELLDESLAREEGYRRWLHDLGRPELLPQNSAHGRLGYHVELTLPDKPFPIHVIGLDSAWLAGDDNDNGKLLLTQHQIGQLATDGEGAALTGFRVVLVHHPLTQLADGADARRLIADYADIVLRGHQHDALLDVWRDPDRGLVELAAGSLYEGSGGDRFPNAYNIIDVVVNAEGRPTRYDLRFRSWSPRGHWHDDGALYRSAPNGRLTIHGALAAQSDQWLPIETPLLEALNQQWAACARARITVQTCHKLLVLFRVAPVYMYAVFDSVGDAVAATVVSWLQQMAEQHALQSEKRPPSELETDPAIVAARAIAEQEGSNVVTGRHVLLAVLSDRQSRMVEELRRTLNQQRRNGFARLTRAAKTEKYSTRVGTAVPGLEFPGEP